MVNEAKYEYVCPRCQSGFAIDRGCCPECGYIGRLEHRVLRLTAMTAAGKLVLEGPPLKAPQKKQPEGNSAAGAVTRYQCPRCGARMNRAFGRCPNSRSCGYVGRMESLTAWEEREAT
jgi:predicted ATP-dependent serine protease